MNYWCTKMDIPFLKIWQGHWYGEKNGHSLFWKMDIGHCKAFLKNGQWTLDHPFQGPSYWRILQGTALPFLVSMYRAPTYSVLAAPSSWASLYHQTCGRRMWTTCMHSNAAQRLYFLTLLKRAGMPHDSLTTVYTTIVRSVMEYACQGVAYGFNR